MTYSEILSARFPLRTLKLVPELRVMSITKGTDYPVEITNDNAPYALPYWHSQALARFILDHRETFAGKSVLDVGCGCGLAAIAAASIGAVADALDPDLRCLDFTERNARANDVNVGLIWGTHRAIEGHEILLAGGLFHEPHGAEIARIARERASLIAVSWQNLWDMQGFSQVGFHELGLSRIHVFASEKLEELMA